jgi:hypothetical protein
VYIKQVLFSLKVCHCYDIPHNIRSSEDIFLIVLLALGACCHRWLGDIIVVLLILGKRRGLRIGYANILY